MKTRAGTMKARADAQSLIRTGQAASRRPFKPDGERTAGAESPVHDAYLALYLLGYIAEDAPMVATAVTALSSRKLSERTERWLKLLSGNVMLALGGIMIVRPEWLL